MKAFIVGTHRYSFRAGTPAEIIGINFINERSCYRCRFDDGVEDLIPLCDAHFFEVISEADVLAGNLPEVVH